jgi:hypothetical protein
MAKIFTRKIITLLVILILLEIVLCVSIEDKALASDSLLTISEKYLVKKYGWMEGNYVKRWPDGVVYVYNGTNSNYKGLPSIIKKINQIIGGKTVFQLSNDKEISKVVLKSYDAPIGYSSQSDWSWDGYNLKKWETSIDKKYDKKYIHRDELFLIIFIQIAGFNYQADEKYYGEWWEFSIDINVEKMLKALYKVPPGYNLLTGSTPPTPVPSPQSSSKDISGSPIEFNIPNEALWNQSIDGSYTVTGNEDTIAWSNVVVEGDLELSFDIQFQRPNGEGNIIIYGNGSGLSDEQLFFGFGPVLSKIMGGTPYDSRFLDDVWMTDVDINKKHSVMIRIVNHKASLFFDGIEILSAFIPEDINTSGRIGLYKYHGETGMDDNGATYSNFRLTASSVVEP